MQETARDTVDAAVERAHALVDLVKPKLRGVLHEIAFAISLVTGTVLVCLSPTGSARTAALVYALSVCALFGTSAALHRGTWSPRAEQVMTGLDHSMIFLLIAGTYTPFAALLLDGRTRTLALGLVWSGALAGITLRLVLGARRWLFTGLYLALGWVALAFLPQLARSGGAVVISLILLGGLFYSVGAVVYATRRPRLSERWFGFHELFHALTLAAFAAHYVAVSVTTYRAA
ncbi:MAG: hemolysin family protein [Frankiales bacterium]|nr:hemolysin family protein [Frankiales bacterium]